MSGGLDRLNAVDEEEAVCAMLDCCGSRRWAERLVRERPFPSPEGLLEAADRTWWTLSEEDWREAFAAHPRIGERALPADAAREQSGVRRASARTLAVLSRVNRDYEERFGHIFIVCASGKSAGQILALCRDRTHNDPQTELRVAAEEQRKITRLRLERFLDS